MIRSISWKRKKERERERKRRSFERAGGNAERGGRVTVDFARRFPRTNPYRLGKNITREERSSFRENDFVREQQQRLLRVPVRPELLLRAAEMKMADHPCEIAHDSDDVSFRFRIRIRRPPRRMREGILSRSCPSRFQKAMKRVTKE